MKKIKSAHIYGNKRLTDFKETRQSAVEFGRYKIVPKNKKVDEADDQKLWRYG